MDFSKIPYNTILGRALRFPLRFLPPEMAIPILQGRLRGKKWIVGSHTHGCWLGSYEHEERVFFEEVVKKGRVVFDVGAHCGFYTLLSSELVGPSGKVFAFEPLPRNIKYLKEHININGVKNVIVVEAAVSDCEGESFFDLSAGGSSSQGKLDEKGVFRVKTISLDRFIESGFAPNPDYIKIDAEGAEFLVLSGAKRILQKNHPTIFLSTHNKDVRFQCEKLLKGYGYRLNMLRRPLSDDLIIADFV